MKLEAECQVPNFIFTTTVHKSYIKMGLMKFLLLLTSVVLVLGLSSCNRNVVSDTKEDKYVQQHIEFVNIQNVRIVDDEFSKAIEKTLSAMHDFERRVNEHRVNKTKYYAKINSACRNDSSLVFIGISSGVNFFFNLMDTIDASFLDQLYYLQRDSHQVVVFRDINDKICSPSLLLDMNEVSESDSLRLNVWKRKGNLVKELFPYFYDTYYVRNGKFIYIERHESDGPSSVHSEERN